MTKDFLRYVNVLLRIMMIRADLLNPYGLQWSRFETFFKHYNAHNINFPDFSVLVNYTILCSNHNLAVRRGLRDDLLWLDHNRDLPIVYGENVILIIILYTSKYIVNNNIIVGISNSKQ